MDGSKPKNAYTCPGACQSIFLIPGSRYLLKRSRVPKGLQPDEPNPFAAQFWAEIVAYRVGYLSGVKVPPAFVAVSGAQTGALIEWFHSDSSRMTPGTDEMEKFIPDYDRKKGLQHNLMTLQNVCGLYRESLNGEWTDHWCKIFLFDALIANTDRHQENWGIIWGKAPGSGSAYWTPAFDNGTSLGFEIREENLENVSIARHTQRGYHHIRMNQDSKKGFGHMELIEHFANQFPQTRQNMRACLEFSLDKLQSELTELVQFQVPVPFTRERAAFVFSLIQYRRDRLLEVLT